MAVRRARRSVFECDPAPAVTLVQEAASPRRRIGGATAGRQQLERIGEGGELRGAIVQLRPVGCAVGTAWAGFVSYASDLGRPQEPAVWVVLVRGCEGLDGSQSEAA